MKSKPSWLHEHTVTLPDGKTVLWSYDSEGDILEIFFEQAPATATIEIDHRHNVRHRYGLP